MCRFPHIVTMKEGWECKQGTGALDNNPVTTYSLHMKGRHHGHKPWILILQNMDSAQSKFINPIHSVVTVQLHWSLKNARADSPGAHCVSGRSGLTKARRQNPFAWMSVAVKVHGRERQKPCMSPVEQSAFFCDLVSLHSQVSLSKATSGWRPAVGGSMCGH